MEKFNTDFEYFWGMIERGESFAFARYADGEVMLMEGRVVNQATQAFTVDKWSAPAGITKVGHLLHDSMTHSEDNYYYAISAPTDNLKDYQFLKHNVVNEKNITFVNLWINANYEKSLMKFSSLKRPVNLICNYKAKAVNFPFQVASISAFPNDCVGFWEENGEYFMDELLEKYKNKVNELFFISCGPVSEIIIHNLYTNNPNNSYIDVGSSIDEFVHGYKTRPYMDKNSVYSRMISTF